MPRPTTLSRYQLGEELTGKLCDFCEAYDATAVRVIRSALSTYLELRLKNDDEGRRRMEAARKRRLGLAELKLVQMPHKAGRNGDPL